MSLILKVLSQFEPKKISLSKRYKTRKTGEPVRLISVSEDGPWPVRGYIGDGDEIHKWSSRGFWGGNHNDLVEVEVEVDTLLSKLMRLIKRRRGDVGWHKD